MKRKGVFSVLAAIGAFCSISVISCNQNAHQPTGTTKAAGNAPTDRIADIPKEMTIDLGNKVTMKLVRIPSGKFMMGSPAGDCWSRDQGPQHEVTLSKPFCMGVCLVTRGQFAAFVADKGYKTGAEKDGWSWAFDGKGTWYKIHGAQWRKPGFDQTNEHPVVCVSHDDALTFCEWLSKKAGRTVRLPTEAQWEYSCRAGTTTL